MFDGYFHFSFIKKHFDAELLFTDTEKNKKVLRHKMRTIQGNKHRLGTCEISKISLSVFDDKRFLLNDGICTLAYFHKELKNHRYERFS